MGRGPPLISFPDPKSQDKPDAFLCEAPRAPARSPQTTPGQMDREQKKPLTTPGTPYGPCTPTSQAFREHRGAAPQRRARALSVCPGGGHPPRRRDSGRCEGCPRSGHGPGQGGNNGRAGRPRSRLVLPAAALSGPGTGVGEGAGRAAARAGLLSGSPAAPPHLRARGRAGAPPARRGTSCSRGWLPWPQTRAGGFQAPATPGPPLVQPAGREQSQENARGRRLESGRAGNAQPLSAAPTPRLRWAGGRRRAVGSAAGAAQVQGPRPCPAYLVLDLGRKPVGRALVEVGHGDQRREEAALGPGLLALGFPAPGPEEWPPRQRLGGRSPGLRRARAVPRRLDPTGSRSAAGPLRSPARTAPTSARGRWGLAGQRDQWRAACSRLAGEGRCAPSSQGSGPRPALTPPRPRPGRPSSGPRGPARGLGALGGFPAAWNAFQLPGLRRRARSQTGRDAPGASWLPTRSLRLPSPQRAQSGGRALLPTAEDPQSSLEARVPGEGAPPPTPAPSSGTSQPPTPVGLTPAQLPPRDRSRLAAKPGCIRSPCLLFTSTSIGKSARPHSGGCTSVYFFFNLEASPSDTFV